MIHLTVYIVSQFHGKYNMYGAGYGDIASGRYEFSNPLADIFFDKSMQGTEVTTIFGNTITTGYNHHRDWVMIPIHKLVEEVNSRTPEEIEDFVRFTETFKGYEYAVVHYRS